MKQEDKAHLLHILSTMPHYNSVKRAIEIVQHEDEDVAAPKQASAVIDAAEFSRHHKYVVLKRSELWDLTMTQRGQLAEIIRLHDARREREGKSPLECVVVEVDWPEYEPTWNAIEARVMNGAPRAQPVQELAKEMKARGI